MKNLSITAFLLCLLFSTTAQAVPVTYDFNFNTDQGLVSGTFISDFDLGQNAPVSFFELTFNGIVFDMGNVIARIGSGATDFTGLSSTIFPGQTLTASLTPGATLNVNTCGAVACVAIWSGIPGLSNGSYNLTQQGVVTRASVPAPAPLLLLGLGLAALGFRRSKA